MAKSRKKQVEEDISIILRSVVKKAVTLSIEKDLYDMMMEHYGRGNVSKIIDYLMKMHLVELGLLKAEEE